MRVLLAISPQQRQEQPVLCCQWTFVGVKHQIEVTHDNCRRCRPHLVRNVKIHSDVVLGPAWQLRDNVVRFASVTARGGGILW